jgi:hypothetical protein
MAKPWCSLAWIAVMDLLTIAALTRLHGVRSGPPVNHVTRVAPVQA